jgi:hypothetical protein
LRGTVTLTAINIEDVSGVLSRTPEGTFQFGASTAATPPLEQLTPDAAERSTAAQQSQVIADLVQNLEPYRPLLLSRNSGWPEAR